LRTTLGKHGSGRYYVVDEKSNIAYPSVTTIIGEMSDKSGLIEWKNRVGEEEAERISTKAANRGTFMHAVLENYVDGLFISKVDNPLQSAFKKAVADNDFTEEEFEIGKNLFFNFHQSAFFDKIESVLFQEEPLWSSKGGGYAGRMDLAIRSIDSKNKIVDYKTSRKPKKEEWIKGYKMQISAYSVALYERHGIMPDSCEIWISCETGDLQTFILERKDIKTYFEEFHEMVKGYHQKFPQ
jgi:genome maintenance exonuclease 1